MVSAVRSVAVWRRTVGFGIVLTGAAVALQQIWLDLAYWPALQGVFTSGSVAALATALGVLPMLLVQAPSVRAQDALLGFSAGVMLAALGFSLLHPALAGAQALTSAPWVGALGVGVAMLVGAGALMALERLLPSGSSRTHGDGGASPRERRLMLCVLAMVLHNVPEGWALGVAALAGQVASPGAGMSLPALTLGIALQNVPEGLVVALTLQALGLTRRWAALFGAASGLVEPVAAVGAAALLGWSDLLLPWGLATAAGAMLFVVSHEVIPESHRQGHSQLATLGLLVGFVLMMVLGTALAVPMAR